MNAVRLGDSAVTKKIVRCPWAAEPAWSNMKKAAFDPDSLPDEQLYTYQVLSSIASDVINRVVHQLEDAGVDWSQVVDERRFQEMKWAAIKATLSGRHLDDFVLKSYELRRPT